ncbi:MAG: GHKL domain-containing protein [Agathobacter sp.]|nr:GHKL domain-containing protein [Agathobacter sp.]
MGNAIPDIPRIYTAIAEWVACLVFIAVLRPRFGRKKIIAISIVVLIAQAIFMHLTGNVSLWFWIPCMLLAYLNMTLFIYACCKTSYWESCYYGFFGFVIAECIASLEWELFNYLFENGGNEAWWLQGICIVFVYGIVTIGMWNIMRRHVPADGYLDINRKDWITALFIAIIVFAVSNLSFVTRETPFSGAYSQEISNMRTLVDIAGVAMLYAHWVLCCENKMRMELESVQNVLQNQYLQYKQSRESIELINYKYHDLKHQIEVLRKEQDPEKRNAFLNQMEDEIKQYELQNKTGNSVLDTVLTSKSMYCDSHGITLTSVVDGQLLDFMETMDICSIFGNALDNAIESVLKIEEKEKRLIHVTVSQQKAFVMIRVENYFEGGLKYAAGQLKTTKKDAAFHGYGIKSIRYTVNKYDGAVDIDTRDNWFNLKILIPLKEVEKGVQ